MEIIFTILKKSPIIYIYNECMKKGAERMLNMTEAEMFQKNIEEFSRIQSYMILAEKESNVYKALKVRYMELKVILTASGTNLTELDMIKE